MNKFCLSSVFMACVLLGIKTCLAQGYFFTTFAGIGAGSSDGTGVNAMFAAPSSVAGDMAWNISAADAHNNTIRQITPPIPNSDRL